MKPGSTFLACIIDRSGSMQSIRSDAIGGFNAFLEEQQRHPDDALFTLVTFNGDYEVVHNAVPIACAQPLTKETYVPDGSTALYDAVGVTIDDIGKRLAAMREEDRPGKIIVAILTDGEENASHRYTREQIASMIRHQQEVYKWEFVFLAANQDAITAAASIAIHAKDTLSFVADGAGIHAAYNTLSADITMRRKRGKQKP